MTDEKFLERLLANACKKLTTEELKTFMSLMSKIAGIDVIGVNEKELEAFKVKYAGK